MNKTRKVIMYLIHDYKIGKDIYVTKDDLFEILDNQKKELEKLTSKKLDMSAYTDDTSVLLYEYDKNDESDRTLLWGHDAMELYDQLAGAISLCQNVMKKMYEKVVVDKNE